MKKTCQSSKNALARSHLLCGRFSFLLRPHNLGGVVIGQRACVETGSRRRYSAGESSRIPTENFQKNPAILRSRQNPRESGGRKDPEPQQQRTMPQDHAGQLLGQGGEGGRGKALPLGGLRPQKVAPACSYGRGTSCDHRGHLAAESCGRTKRCRPNKEGKVGAPGHHMGTKVAKKGGKQKRGYGRGARILLILLWCARQESNLRPTA